jgi:hypothetical protein
LSFHCRLVAMVTLQMAEPLGVAHFRVAAEVADEDDFVDRGHGGAPVPAAGAVSVNE